jgi:hypothetical protein
MLYSKMNFFEKNQQKFNWNNTTSKLAISSPHSLKKKVKNACFYLKEVV